MTDAFGHFFYLSLLVGQVLLARCSSWGWVARIVGDIGWTVLGVVIGYTSIWMWGLLFVIQDVRGFVLWRRDARSEA